MRMWALAASAVFATNWLGIGSAAAQDIAPEPAAAPVDPPNPLTVSASVDLVSDYRFRGISFSDEDPAIQGSIDLSHQSGFYVGTWASSIEDSEVFGHTEIDLYAGFATEVGPGTSIDLGLLYYLYPNGEDAAGDSDYFEPYLSLTQALGPVEATVGAAYAWEQDAIGGDDNIYLYGNLGTGIPGTPVSLSAHLGYSEGSLAPTGNYFDWSLGASIAWRALTFGIAYVDTDLPDVAGQDATAVLSISAGF